MNQVLYRKYRSRSFDEVIGQETVVSILRESILKGSVSHAYLFCGPRGTGKTSIARILSRAVNCENFEKKNDVCNECRNCLSIINEETLDIIEMDAASNRGIEEIRNLKDSINYLPTTLKKKVYIIDEAHMLTKEAFNALLKTLEEPPAHVVFILATTEAHKLPITILSRVQRYDFRLATKDEMVKKLKFILKEEGKKAKDDVWDVIYAKSGGSFRDAESLLGKVISNTESKELDKEYIYKVLGIYSDDEVESFINALLQRDSKGFLKHLNSLKNLSGNINTLIDQVLQSLKEKLVEQTEKGEPINKITEIVNLLIKIKRDIKDFDDKKMVLELEVLSFFNNSSKPALNNAKSIDSKSFKSENKDEKKNVTVAQERIISTEDEEPAISSSVSTDASLAEKIAYHSLITLPRLKAIILNSDVQIENGALVFYNQYKFNVNFLKKSEISQLLNQIVKEIDSSLTSIDFRVGGNSNLDVKISDDQSETFEVQVSSSSDNEISSVNKSDVLEDNSEIIENLL